MRKKALPAILLLLASCLAGAYAVPLEKGREKGEIHYGTVSGFSLSPETPRTGERSFARIKTGDDLKADDMLNVRVEDNPWFHVSDIRLNHEEDEILIWFIPFDPGIKAIPDVLAGGRVYSGIPLTVISQLGKMTELYPPPGLALLPWTRLLFALIVAGSLLAVFLIWSLIRFAGRRSGSLMNSAAHRLKRRAALASLGRAVRNKSDLSEYEFSVMVTGFFKEYLETAGLGRITCLTTGEIKTALPGVPGKELELLDAVKFASCIKSGQSPLLWKKDSVHEAASALYSYACEFENREKSAPPAMDAQVREGASHSGVGGRPG